MDPDKLFSKSAEAAVVGSMIVDPSIIPKVIGTGLTGESFFLPENKVIFDSLVSMSIASQEIDAVLLRAELDRRGQLVGIAGNEAASVAYIGACMDSFPSSANGIYYAERVKEKEGERKLISAVDELGKITAGHFDADEVQQQIQDLAFNLTTGTSSKVVSVAERAEDVADAMSKGQLGIIPTGLRVIDYKIQGFSPGQLAIIAARPSMGKTALALSIVINIARSGTGVLFFTLEQPVDDVIERLLCSIATVSLADAKQNRLGDQDQELLGQAVDELKTLPIFICSSAWTLEQQAALIRIHKKINNIAAVFVDHIGLMKVKAESRVQEISRLSKGLKVIAQAESIPIIALSQLNRSVEARTNKRPVMSDLRDSGSIEEDADVIMLLYREEYYNVGESLGEAEANIVKQRNGPTGTVKLCFLSESVKFGDLERW